MTIPLRHFLTTYFVEISEVFDLLSLFLESSVFCSLLCFSKMLKKSVIPIMPLLLTRWYFEIPPEDTFILDLSSFWQYYDCGKQAKILTFKLCCAVNVNWKLCYYCVDLLLGIRFGFFISIAAKTPW